MIAWESVWVETDPWHLTTTSHGREALCGARIDPRMDAQRDPHKIEKYGGVRCGACWTEWRLRTAASYARQDQHEAGRR